MDAGITLFLKEEYDEPAAQVVHWSHVGQDDGWVSFGNSLEKNLTGIATATVDTIRSTSREPPDGMCTGCFGHGYHCTTYFKIV